MTDFNSHEDFLRALEENPQWKEAVRLIILGEEVLQLPVRFTAFMIRTEAFMERIEAFMADQVEFNRRQVDFNRMFQGFMERTEAFMADQVEFNRQQVDFNRKVEGFMERTEAFMADQVEFNRQVTTFMADQVEFNRQVTTFMADQTEFNRKVEGFMERTDAMITELVDLNRQQAEFNRQVLIRFDRMEGDIGNIKGFFAEYKVTQHARFVVRELDDDLQYVRNVPPEEMEQMGLQAIAEGLLPRSEWRSFMEADLVIETTDGANPRYLVLEISYTGDRRDVDRARRNASIIAELKNCPARPVVASVRNVDEVDEDIQSGFMTWYQISQQQMAR